MIGTTTKRSAVVTLPELDIPPEHRAIRHSTPPDLKGLKYTHLPGLGSDGRTSVATDDDQPVLLPMLDDEPHPYPYIISPAITLNEETLQIEDDQTVDNDEIEDASQYFLIETKFSKEYLELLLDDLMESEYTAVSEIVLNVDGEKEEIVEAEQQLLVENAGENIMQIDPETNEAEEIEQELTEEEMQALAEEISNEKMDNEIRYVVWETIESILPEWELKKPTYEMQRLSPQLKQALSSRMAGQQAEEELQNHLEELTIENVLYEYHQMLHQQKLEDNEALHFFQVDLIGNSLTRLILQDSLRGLESDFKLLREEESRMQPIQV